MNRARPVALECALVLGRGITLVDREAILRPAAVGLEHPPIPGDFGEDAGSGDRIRQRIPPHQGGLWEGDSRDREAVDQDVLGLGIELSEGANHARMGGLEDVDPIDLLGIHERQPALNPR